MIFVGTFEESDRTFEDKKTGEKRTVTEFWRNQAHVRLNGLVVADYDHLEGDVRQIWEEAYAKLSDEDKARILLVFITPSGHGLKVVFMADPNIGNLIDNQLVMSYKLGFEVDDSCKDGCRGAFQTTDEDIIFINEEKLFTYENEEFGKKFNDSYHERTTGLTGLNQQKKSLSRVVRCKKITMGWSSPRSLRHGWRV